MNDRSRPEGALHAPIPPAPGGNQKDPDAVEPRLAAVGRKASHHRRGNVGSMRQRSVLFGLHVTVIGAALAACGAPAGQAPTTHPTTPVSVASPVSEPRSTTSAVTTPTFTASPSASTAAGNSVTGPMIGTMKLVQALQDFLKDRGAPQATEIHCPGPLEGINGKSVNCTLTVAGKNYNALFTAHDVTKTRTNFTLKVKQSK